MSWPDRTLHVHNDDALPGVRMAEVWYGGGMAQRRHWHEEANITLVVSGALEEVVGRRTERAGALSVVVKPACTDHADRYGPEGAHTFAVQLRREVADALRECDSPIAHWHWLHGGPAAAHMLGLLGALRGRRADAAELERRLADVFGCVGGELGRGGSAHVPGWLERTRQALDDSSSSPPRVRDLAAEAAVHPVYLARQFRRFYGCSITGYLKRRRVQAAARLLRRSDISLSTLSYVAGFADQSHLCRVFKAGTGMTPLAFRHLAAGR